MTPLTRRTKLETTQLRNEMRRLKQIGNTPERIMSHLSLNRDNYNFHMTQIFKEDRKELKNLTVHIIEHEILTCRSRMERSIEVLDSIARDTKNKPYDRIKAEELKQETAVNILRLLVESPNLVNLERVDGKITETHVPLESKPISAAMDKLFTEPVPEQ